MSRFGYRQVIGTLNRLQELQPPVFGAEVEGFRLNPALSEDSVLAFERKHGIHLPDDFREFLTIAGNGGAGPFYGVFPLGVVDDNFGFREWHENDDLVGVLHQPFPFDEEWNDLSMMPADDLADLDPTRYEEQQAEFDSIYWGTALVNGAIPISHMGCAIRVWLVVAGSQAGNLWEDRRSEYGGLRPIRLKNGCPATFSGWYLDWLSTSLAAVQG